MHFEILAVTEPLRLKGNVVGIGEAVILIVPLREFVCVIDPVSVYGCVVGIGDKLNVFEGDNVVDTHFVILVVTEPLRLKGNVVGIEVIDILIVPLREFVCVIEPVSV